MTIRCPVLDVSARRLPGDSSRMRSSIAAAVTARKVLRMGLSACSKTFFESAPRSASSLAGSVLACFGKLRTRNKLFIKSG